MHALEVPWEEFAWLESLQGYVSSDGILSGQKPHEVEQTMTTLVREIGRLIDVKRAADSADTEPDAIEDTESQYARGRGYELPSQEGPSHDQEFFSNSGITALIERRSTRVTGLLLFFKTRRQHTWFVATSTGLYCVLDDAKTRGHGRLIQWRMNLEDAMPINVRPREKRATGLVNVGSRHNWLYSQKHLHPDPQALKATIEETLDDARSS